MTITRLTTLTAETQTIADLEKVNSSVSADFPTISSTKARTGTYSYRSGGNNAAFGRNIGSQTTCRIGYWINHLGPSGSGTVTPHLFILSSGIDINDSPMIRVWWDNAAGLVKVSRAVGSSTFEDLASETPVAGITQTDVWNHWALTYKPHATEGFLTVWINGQPFINITGDTRLSYWNGSQQTFTNTFTHFYVAGSKPGTVNAAFANFAYIDDIYVDSYDAEPDVPVPARRFLTRIANGAGVDAAWTPLASTNVSQIDDGAPNGGPNDGDTTYNHTDTVNLRDTFTKDPVAIPTGYRIVGAIPFAHCKTLDVGPEISLHLWDGANYADSPDFVPPFSYTVEVAHRFATMPDASPFTEAGVNGLSIGYRSRGSFV